MIIEKEGIADVFAPFAFKSGIAILNVRGFFTENADDYSQTVLDMLGGNNIATFHDFDAAGVVIGKKANGIVTLGVDLDLVKKLKIQLTDVEEVYDSDKGGHWKWLNANHPGYEHLQYLKQKRVEIDSVLAATSAKNLWGVVLDRLGKAFPNRNYNRALYITDYDTPIWYDEFTDMAEKLFGRKAAAYTEEVRDKYSNYKGFIKDIQKQEQEIYQGQRDAVEGDEIVDGLRRKLEIITSWVEENMEAEEEDEE